MCLKKLKDLEKINGLELKNYDLIIVNTDNEEKAEKIKYLSKIIPKFTIEDNIKIGILNSIISINLIIKMIINKQKYFFKRIKLYFKIYK